MCFRSCLKKLTVRQLVMLFGIAAGGLLSVALVGQYGFDLHPCTLCIYQRIPYAMIALLGVAAIFIRAERWLLKMALFCVLLFTVDGAIAFYHAGVELHWFPGLSGCSNTASQGQSLEEMRRAIMEAPLVTCDQAMIEVWGLSMAAWNALAAFACTLAGGISLCVLRGKSRGA
jgi:disulfide bond formation protein DsbB